MSLSKIIREFKINGFTLSTSIVSLTFSDFCEVNGWLKLKDGLWLPMTATSGKTLIHLNDSIDFLMTENTSIMIPVVFSKKEKCLEWIEPVLVNVANWNALPPMLSIYTASRDLTG